MIKSRKYKSWIEQVRLFLLIQLSISQRAKWPTGLKLPIVNDFQLRVFIGERKKRSDLDNLQKALLDALQRFGVIMNDSQCIKISSEYGDAPEGCRLLLQW
jgi:Holliday junction resolvase RusA-like endonuclease